MRNFNYLLFTFLLLFVSCIQVTLSDKEIMERVWKCGQPCGLSDVLIFEKTNYATIKNDTVIHLGIAIGKIVNRSFNRFTEDTKIAVINLKDTSVKDTCIYHAK